MMDSLKTRAPQKRQSGVAIITAMLLIAMGTITMVAIGSRQQLDMHRDCLLYTSDAADE